MALYSALAVVKKEDEGFWLRGGQVIAVSDRQGYTWGAERERETQGDMAYCDRTKSYFHQFTEVEINMTAAYLFQ